MSAVMMPQQRRRNRIAGLILLAFVLAVFGWTFVRGAGFLARMAGQ
ncbi:coiled-coil domain-containing protein 56 protein [Bordetella hinzii 1277]|nr:coiled-coil domain-containing protein 56 protein [Bordetella hinzii 1277]